MLYRWWGGLITFISWKWVITILYLYGDWTTIASFYWCFRRFYKFLGSLCYTCNPALSAGVLGRGGLGHVAVSR